MPLRTPPQERETEPANKRIITTAKKRLQERSEGKRRCGEEAAWARGHDV
jgi:hypothetical protein